jgi:ABC-type glycerol-3-phosphate transport system permease component
MTMQPAKALSARRLRSMRSHAVLAILSFVSIFPLYWMIVTSLRAPNEIFSTVLWPEHPSFENFQSLLAEIPFPRMALNTVLVSAVVTGLQLFTGLLAAYVFAYWRGRLTNVLFIALTVTWLIPQQVIMIPNFITITHLGLLDTLAALIVPNVASSFAIMLLYQNFRNFPREVIEAGIMDGARHWRILWGLIVPNMNAALASLAILLFITTWNDYFWPLLITRSLDNAVIQIGLQMFFTSEGNLWGPLMSAATLASLPILALYVVLQRQIVDSFVKSGLR